MRFDILGGISQVETFATCSTIREIARLRKFYGRGRWRKRKGIANVKARRRFHMSGGVALVRSGRDRTQGIQDQETALGIRMAKSAAKQLVVCLANEGYEASLERRKIYVMLRDTSAEKHGLMRVIDESGDHYLYPKTMFRSVELPQSVRRAVLSAA